MQEWFCSCFLPSDSLKTLYNTIIKPIFEYCISVWGDGYKKDITKLQRLQSRAIRIVAKNFDYSIPSSSIIKNLKCLSVSEVRDYQTSCIMYKSLKNKCPNYINDKFNFNQCINDVNTRSKQNDCFYVPRGLGTTNHLVNRP